jgi:ribosomal protein L37AE/L43A
MEDYPKTLAEFEERFSTEDACRSYLYALRWPDGFVCPRCGQRKAWLMGNGLYWCSSCDYKVSVTAGTIFERTKKPLTDWFRVIWWVTGQKYGASAKGLQRMLASVVTRPRGRGYTNCAAPWSGKAGTVCPATSKSMRFLWVVKNMTASGGVALAVRP